jgi:hypothetical protein
MQYFQTTTITLPTVVPKPAAATPTKPTTWFQCLKAVLIDARRDKVKCLC